MPLVQFTDPAAAFDTVALTSNEIDRVREVVQSESLSTVALACASLTTDQNRATRYDLDQFFNQVGEGTFLIAGGADGVDLNTERDRVVIRNRVRARLGLAIYSSDRPVMFGVACGQRGRY